MTSNSEIINKVKKLGYDDPATNYAINALKNNYSYIGEIEKLAYKRHLKDIIKSEETDFEYKFQYEVAEEGILKFIQKYCYFTDGEKAGQLVKLLDYQIFMISAIFGWVHKEKGSYKKRNGQKKITNYRRFKTAFIEKARKNGKTMEVSWIAKYMALADGYYKSEVYTSANAKEQAKISWENCARSLKASKKLIKKVKIRPSTSVIYYPKKESTIKALSSETKNLDGLNPHCGIVDEYHEHKNNQIYKLLQDGAVQQNEALIMIITTAGFDLDKPCYSEYLYCKEILNEEKINDNKFIFISEMDQQDDIKNPDNWLKSNPLFRYFGQDGIDKLKIAVDEGLDKPEELRNMLTKTLNKWVDMTSESYIKLSEFKKCGIKREDLFELCKNKSCYVGVDLSIYDDLTGISFVFPIFEDGIRSYAVITICFIPEERVTFKEDTDGVPYSEWINKGFMRTCSGLTIDNNQIEEFIINFSKENEFNIIEIDFDGYQANQIMRSMEEKGYKIVEIRQGTKTLSFPTIEFRNQVINKKIIHDNSPVLNWNVKNAIIKLDHNRNVQLDKSKRNKKIDGLASCINAFVRASTHEFNETEFDINSSVEEYLNEEGD